VQDVETSHAELAEVTRQNDSEYADALQIKGGGLHRVVPQVTIALPSDYHGKMHKVDTSMVISKEELGK